MRRLRLHPPLAAILFAIAVAGCASPPGFSSSVSDLHGGSATAPGHEVQPVGYKSPTTDESVVLEADVPPERTATSGWTRLLNPFQKSQRIPLPLSPRSDNGDAASDAAGF
jgi:hypothetical protein